MQTLERTIQGSPCTCEENRGPHACRNSNVEFSQPQWEVSRSRKHHAALLSLEGTALPAALEKMRQSDRKKEFVLWPEEAGSDAVRTIWNNCTLCARLEQLLSDVYSVESVQIRKASLRFWGDDSVLNWRRSNTALVSKRKRGQIENAEKRLLKMVWDGE